MPLLALRQEGEVMSALKTITAMADKLTRFEAENAKLRAELAAEREKARALEVTKCTSPWPDSPPCRGISSVQSELAAAQATIAQMRELLEKATSYTNCPSWSPSMTDDIVKFLAIPANQDAPHEALAKECERLAEEFGRRWTQASQVQKVLNAEAAAHRARKEAK